jgi:hypothetical protein
MPSASPATGLGIITLPGQFKLFDRIPVLTTTPRSLLLLPPQLCCVGDHQGDC